MKTHLRFYGLVIISLLFASACSALPGLRVLSGQVSGDTVAEEVVTSSDMVMADKSGLTDPALTIAADRIELANSGNIDIIELHKDLNEDAFIVYMLIRPPDQTTTNADFLNGIRRAIELTWQGTMNQSQGSDLLRVVILFPNPVPTLDQQVSFAGVIALNTQITRPDAITYLDQRPNTMNSFNDLIAQGKLDWSPPQDTEWYQGQPNHAMFLPSVLAGQVQSQDTGDTGASSSVNQSGN